MVSISHKISFHLPENLLPQPEMQNSFKNAFPLDGNIKLAMAGVFENGRKNGFQYPENQFPPAGIRLLFKNWISQFPLTKENL